MSADSDWSRKRDRQGDEKSTVEDGAETEKGAGAPAASPSAGHPRHPHAAAPPYYPYPHPGEQPYGPPRGYEPAYASAGYGHAGYPPPYMAPPYGMPYPPYPMYPGHPPPPPHGAFYPDPMARYPPQLEMGEGPYGHGALRPIAPAQRAAEEERKPPARQSADSSRTEGDDDTEENEGDMVSGAVTARLKTYIKPRIPSTQEVLDRRSRKNAQSRQRATKLRHRISEIEVKPPEERTQEEMHIWAQYEQRRQRKNNRSRDRALEKKEEIERILAKPEKKRTKIEKQFLETALSAKKRKNEGDRLRRHRLKQLGINTKGLGLKPGVSARGPLPPQYQHRVPQPPTMSQQYGMGMQGMGEIPLSPLPTIPHHHGMQSPGGFGSPGMMPGIGFPSPGPRRGGTPGRPDMAPYMPPHHAYDGQGTSPDERGSSARIEQRRNADGSMSISIGGRGGAGSSDDQVHMSDVSGLLLDNDSGYNDSRGKNQKDDDDDDDDDDVDDDE